MTRLESSSREPALLEVQDLAKDYPVRDALGRSLGVVHAVDGVSFRLERGKTLGLVGESGSGKSTVGRAVLRLIEPTRGSLRFAGIDLLRAAPRELTRLRRRMQIVFQDPHASLNPRLSIGEALAEPLTVHDISRGPEVQRRVSMLMDRVGLPESFKRRFPHELSGGQCQRVSIARALSLEPELIVCDESTSALDMSVQAQILNLLLDLQRELGVAYLFITHNLSVVRHLADQVLVMYLGKVVEQAAAAQLFEQPKHPYTRALLSANPHPDPDVPFRPEALQGEMPSPLSPPAGCTFNPRCREVHSVCLRQAPRLLPLRVTHHPESARASAPGVSAPGVSARGASAPVVTVEPPQSEPGRQVACHLYQDAV